MSFKFNSIALLLSSLLTGSGAWVGYELYKPKTVKGWVEWKGLKLASETDENIWKALYFQNESELQGTTKSAEELKKTCVEYWKKPIENKNLEYVEKFCVNVLKSRKARIIAEGFDKAIFLSTDEDYKLAYTFNRYSDSFLALLGSDKATRDSEIDEQDSELLRIYKNHCETALNTNDTKINVTKQICSKQYEYVTAEDKLKHDGYELKTDKELEDSWDTWKGSKSKNYLVGNSLLEDIKDRNGGDDSWIKLQDNKKEFGIRFKAWCQEQKVEKLFKRNFYKDIYPKFKNRCGTPKAAKT
ncbi:hypothetical protein A6V39_04065 [Candidatus Mycoplasma haematobovis]|uniref:Uncharacterized protein n=1 Tax=Candidatus Mycoplasma haematobovis TaxID=432608 RepID=A0A1A9QD98_9MOLU|nr:hypothetical protein [Candidatus Mycoplasma haematobovis]OAL10064.1 hypothetical protein A6V39_04065 [Candidatus Mycoplasma haematobovis]